MDAPLGGAALSRGAVYHLLSNPVYRGAIRHRTLLHPNCHPPIIDEDTWDAVQSGLGANAPKTPTIPKAGEGALLKGLVFDDLGNAMQPIHANRHGRRYHYYVTAARVHGDDREVGSLPRVAAPTLEAVVVGHVSQLLRRSWCAGEAIELRVRDALRKVVVGAARLQLTLIAEACRPSGEGGEHDTIEIDLAITLKHRQSATLILPDIEPRPAATSPDRSLARALCVTRQWRRQLEAGEVASIKDLAIAEGLCPRHTGRLYPMAYLAPDLVEAILAGHQPRAMSLHTFTAKPLPRDWDQQRKLFWGLRNPCVAETPI